MRMIQLRRGHPHPPLHRSPIPGGAGASPEEPMADEFQPGDVVERIGGDGHRMIVEDVQDGIVSCVWVLNGAVVRGHFPAAALQYAE